MEDQNGKILTLKQATEFLQISEVTLYRWINAGKIPCYKVEGHWRFFEGELRRWVKTQDMNFRKLAAECRPIILRHELEWKAERDSRPVSIEHGQEIMARVCQDVLDLRTRIEAKKGAAQFRPTLDLDEILKKLKEIRRYQTRMDDAISFKAFWANGDLIFRSVNDVLIGLLNI